MELLPALNPVKELGAFIRDQRTTAQISLRALAGRAGMSNPYLSQVERGLRRPSADILAQIARGLSISVETLLAKAGILDTATMPDVVAAIRADDHLSERHKISLIDIYSALRTEAETKPDPAAGSPGGREGEVIAERPTPHIPAGPVRSVATTDRLPGAAADQKEKSCHFFPT